MNENKINKLLWCTSKKEGPGFKHHTMQINYFNIIFKLKMQITLTKDF